MRKHYNLFFIFFVLLFTANAQQQLPERNSIAIDANIINSQNKLATCNDIIRYPESKLTGLFEVDTLSPNAISAVSQAYHFVGSGNIHGINALVMPDVDGIPANSDSVSLLICVYSLINYDSDYPNAPENLMHSDTVFAYDVGFDYQDLLFSSPVAVSDSFVLTIELNPLNIPDPLPYYGFTGYGDGLAEKLAWANFQGFWYNAYTDWQSVGGWDSDMLLSPIFEHDINAEFGVDTQEICLGMPVSFMDSSSSNMNSMFYTAMPTSVINFGNGDSGNLDSVYTYPAAGSFTSMLTLTHYGYDANCMDSSSTMIMVYDTSIAAFGFSEVTPGTFDFTDMSANGYNYSWDFGDGDTASIPSPQHTYASAGNFTVCLTVSDSNGCNVNTLCQQISSTVGVSSLNNKGDISIYPVPASDFLKIELPEEFNEGEVAIKDVLGNTVKSVIYYHNNSIKVPVQELSSGVYFVAITSNGKDVYKKRILVDR